MLVRVIATVVLVAVFWLAARLATLVPGRAQGAVEMALDLVRVNIAEEVLGKESGRRATPVLSVVFFGVLAMNIPGESPGLDIARSTDIGTAMLGAALGFAT